MKMQAVNSFLPSYEYVPDGEPHVFDDRVYVYGSHDRFNGTHYCLNDYVCWSAHVSDLSHWHYEGVIYRKMQDPMAKESSLLFAPDVQQGPDGRYYLYYGFDFSGVMAVAVCDTPAGAYAYYGNIAYEDGTLLGDKEGEPFQFDPGIFVDEDGRIYLYSGFCPVGFPWQLFRGKDGIVEGGMVIELEQDMKTVKKGPKVIAPYTLNSAGTGFEGHEFFEAPSMRKIGNTYYFIYSSKNGHELCYATSTSPTDGFTYRGILISNGDSYFEGRTDGRALNYTGNNHGSIVKLQDQWYVFYHRHTNRHQFSRQACADPLKMDAKGLFRQAEMTSCGLNGKPLVGKGTYEARIACNLISRAGAMRYERNVLVEEYHPYFTQEGEDREDSPNQYIANMQTGTVAGFKYFTLWHVTSISVKMRGKGTGKLLVSTEIGGMAVAEIVLHASEGWSDFKTSASPMFSNHGNSRDKRALYFTYLGEGAFDFFSFTLS